MSEQIKEAFTTLKSAMQEDFNYAWTWHCNLACCAMDEGMEPQAANRAAARFMKLCFDVDTSKETELAHFQPK